MASRAACYFRDDLFSAIIAGNERAATAHGTFWFSSSQNSAGGSRMNIEKRGVDEGGLKIGEKLSFLKRSLLQFAIF